VYCGIDPGLKGGISFLNLDGSIKFYTPMPVIGSEIDVTTILSLIKINVPYQILIEHAQPMPKQGVVSVFNYGKGFGLILGLVQGLKIPWNLVKPRIWQKQMFQNTNIKDNPKARALIAAKRIWPNDNFILRGCRKPHDGIIDSLLIAEFLRKISA